MDWSPYINRSQATLLRLIGVVFATIGLDSSARPAVISRGMHAKVLHTLLPAESGLRRLVFVLALELERGGYVPPKGTKRAALDRPIPKGEGRLRLSAFRLIDPRKFFEGVAITKRPRFTRGAPNISLFDGFDQRVVPQSAPEPTPDDLVDATRLCNRLLALKGGLEDIPKQAKRLLRLKARRQHRVPPIKPPMRPGLPPGWRRKGSDEIDEALRDCHSLAIWARDAAAPG